MCKAVQKYHRLKDPIKCHQDSSMSGPSSALLFKYSSNIIIYLFMKALRKCSLDDTRFCTEVLIWDIFTKSNLWKTLQISKTISLNSFLSAGNSTTCTCICQNISVEGLIYNYANFLYMYMKIASIYQHSVYSLNLVTI